jgi:hypothetical protein
MLIAGSLRAADKSFPGTFRGGIGASLGIENLVLVDDGDIMHYPLGVAGLYVPMIISDCVKIEPEIGYYRYSSSWDGGSESSNDRFRFGLGIFYASFLGKDTFVYLGIRGGLLYNQRTYSSDYDPDSREREKVDFFVGPAVGAEHFLSDYFSLGAEVQFNYIHEGNWDGDGYDEDRSVYYLSNNTHFFARFYFGATSPTAPADMPGRMEPPTVPEKKKPAAPEEFPAEIRHVQPPPEEPKKVPADAKQPDEKALPPEEPAPAAPADEKTQPPEEPAPPAPAVENPEGEKNQKVENRDGNEVE